MEGGTEQPGAGLGRRQWVTLLVVTVSTFLVLVDLSTINIALPQILGDLGGTLGAATWVRAGDLLTFAALLLLFGKLGDLFGRRRVFVWGLAVFAAASLGAGFATSVEALVAARIAQGVGAAMLTPSALALIKAAFPPERLGLAFGVEGITAGAATAIGPVLGGILTTTLSWRWIFLVNAPLAIAAIAATLLIVPESRDTGATGGIDLPGALLSGAGLCALVFALIEGPGRGWDSAPIAGSLAAAAVLLGAFVLVERRARQPLVDLALFRDRVFAVGVALRGVVLFVLLGTVFVLPLYWQTQLGYSALKSALVFLPLSIVSFFCSPVAGSLADRYDSRWLVGFGFTGAAAGALWLSRLTPESGWAFFLAPLALFGLGLSFLLASTVTAPLRSVPDERSGQASGILTTAGEIGSQLGLVAAAAVLQGRLVAGVGASLASADLPPGVADGVRAGLAGGEFGAVGAPSPDGAAAGQVARLIQVAFADAVGGSLLVVAVAAALGAALALLFFSTPAGAGAEPESGVEAERADTASFAQRQA